MNETLLFQSAIELFGPERAKELRPEIEQLSREIETLYTYDLEFDDEP